MEIIQHDVRRLDRLITDISDASRLDAELAREDAAKVDLKKFVGDLIVGVARHRPRQARRSRSTSRSASCRRASRAIFVHRPRSQARPGHHQSDRERPLLRAGRDRPHHRQPVAQRPASHHLTVDDNGPGIRADNIDRIFERFYTDRPSGEAFGQNSGLGLSISRQIVEAHGGTLTAENIPGTKPGEVRGARFVVTLPAEG